MKHIKNLLVAALLIAVPIVGLVSTPVLAQSKAEVCAGVGAAGGTCDDGGQVNALITNGINLLSYVVGIVAVVMIIVAGFKYITASGDSNNIASAKNTIIFAIIGLVIAAMARFITGFILNRTP